MFVHILVTNDDGIDSLGLHALANAMRPFGEVTVVAPASEHSGAGASLGTLTFEDPVVRRVQVDALPGIDAWSVTGPPALCVMYAQLGAFGGEFDLIVSGINPGQNVGWSVYHSGTIGACLTGRNRGTSGLAMSIGFHPKDVQGQTWEQIVEGMHWETAADIAAQIVEAMIASPGSEPVVISCNVPNKEIADLDGWKVATVGSKAPRELATGSLNPIADPDGGSGEAFNLSMDWGKPGEVEPGTDAFYVRNNTVAVSWLGRLCEAEPDGDQRDAVAARLDSLLS